MANDIENRIEQYVDILVAESDADRDEIQDKMYRFVHKYHLPVNKAASKICPEQDIEIPESFEEADNKARKQDELEHHIDTLVAKSDADRDKIQDMIHEFVDDYKVPLDDAVLTTYENFNIEPPESVGENGGKCQEEDELGQHIDILVAKSDADRDKIQDMIHEFVDDYKVPLDDAVLATYENFNIKPPESASEDSDKYQEEDELEQHVNTLVAKSDADRDKIQDMIQEFVNDYKVPLDDAVLATCENFNIEPPESVRENNSNPQNPHEETNSDQPFNLDIIKRQVINKDNNECQNCGFDENLTVDHIVPRDCGGNFTTTNTVTLCEACYNSKNAEKTHKKPDYPKNWDKVRKKVYQRDDYRCQNCGLAGSYHQEGHTELHAHHIVPRAKRGNDVMSNYTTLCKYCHENLHDHL
jgi:5-methylcytosine-specific restriction endonuclease McrA/uncharacterized protein YpuA (DUF1002 family)